jgi:hypothetical protein
MEDLVIKPGMRFLHSYFIESDLRTPQTMVITKVSKNRVYFTPAELYDGGNHAGSWKKDRESFGKSVKQWILLATTDTGCTPCMVTVRSILY